MQITFFMFYRSVFFLAVWGLGFGLITNIHAQTTNRMPPNVFLTDDGKLFWYQSKKRLIDVKKIQSCPIGAWTLRERGEIPKESASRRQNGFKDFVFLSVI